MTRQERGMKLLKMVEKMKIDENTKVIQNIACDILKSFHETCEKNEISYSLAYGTMLGAIRHAGFIPWDDDVDVFMTLDEYEKFKRVFKSGEYMLLDWDIDKTYPYLFPKICKRGTTLIERNISDLNYNVGVYIDIFVLYQVPNGLARVIKKTQTMIAYKLYRLVELNLEVMGTSTRVVARVAKRILSLNKLIIENNRIYKRSKGELLRDTSMLDESTYLKIDEMNKLKKVAFENIEVYVCENYHEILTRLYGDYMQLPPEGQRSSNHDFYKLEV